MILNGHDLALCMMACPDNARKKSLFDEFKDKIKTAEEVIACMVACPETPMKFYLFKKINSLVFVSKELARLVCYLPDQESALELILKNENKINEDFFTQERGGLFFDQPCLI